MPISGKLLKRGRHSPFRQPSKSLRSISLHLTMATQRMFIVLRSRFCSQTQASFSSLLSTSAKISRPSYLNLSSNGLHTLASPCRSSSSYSSASPARPTYTKQLCRTSSTSSQTPPHAIDGTASSQAIRTPDVPQFLGLGGVIPFACGALFTTVSPDAYVTVFANATQLYAASILSFLGGVHWGLALRHASIISSRDFIVSVVPSLVGWGAALSSPHPGLLILSSSFAALYGYDRLRLAAARISPSIPPWYLPMRLPLTVAAAGGCAITWITVYRCDAKPEETEEESQ